MVLRTKEFYEFGPFRLDPAEQLLQQADQRVALTPKAFELLIFLVQNQGRLISKEQIMQAVWPESFVEEANLTVLVSTLRKALGEKDGNIRYIETVPKRGYRFTASVREIGEATDHSANVSDSSQVVEKPDLQLYAPAAAKEFPLQIDESLSEDRRSARVGDKHRLRTPRAVLAIAGLLGALAIVGSYLMLHRAHMVRATHSIAVLPLQNLRQDPGDDFLGYSLADAVITKLDYVSSLTVRPSSAVQKYRNQVLDIRQVGADLQVETLLVGGFLRDGDDLRITYQLIDARREKILGRGSIDLKYDKLLRVQDAVAQEIIKGLELNLTPSEAERIKPIAPVDPLAYEYYLRGVDLHGQHKFPMAIKMLEKSTEIDPNYAPAWAYLGAAFNSDAAFEFGGREQYRRAQTAYERALALEPSLLDAQIFLANLLVDTGKVEEAVPLLRKALETNPNNAAAHWELGYAYRFAGMLNESVAECEHARAIDPLVKANGSVLNAYLYLGEYDKFLRSLPEIGDSAFLLFYRGFGEFHQKNWKLATKDFDRAFELDPTLYTQVGKALSDWSQRREQGGLQLLRAMDSKIAERGVGDPEAAYKIAQAYTVLGDKEAALRVLRGSVEGGFFAYRYLARDPLLDALRNETEFEEILNIARQRHLAFQKQFFPH